MITGRTIIISTEAGKLYFQVPDYSKVELLPESDNSFFYISLDGDFEVTFVSDDTGLITQLLYREGEIEIPFDKIGRSHPE